MVRDGIYYAAALGGAGAILSFLFGPWWGLPFFIVGAFCLYFFRDPERSAPAGDVAVAPADGRVVHLRERPEGGSRISIFLNIFNVHVNRSPVSGEVKAVEYQRGDFRMAHREAASEANEQNTLRIQPTNERSSEVVVRQIAGLVARRIVCYKRPGDRVEKGERIGLIKFGSRLDVLLGPEWDVTVAVGDSVQAGVTVLGRLAPKEQAIHEDAAEPATARS